MIKINPSLKQLFGRPENIYLTLVSALIFSKVLLSNIWTADQFIVYNFLTLLMLSAVSSVLIKKASFVIRYAPFLIFILLFLDPEKLKIVFALSHIFILFIVVSILIRRSMTSPYKAKLDYAIIPLEIIILLHF